MKNQRATVVHLWARTS